MSGLIKKGLVLKTNNLPAKYMLTDTGRQLASKLLYGSQTDSESDNSGPVESPHKVQKAADYRRTEDSPKSMSPHSYKQTDENSQPRYMTTTSKNTDLIELESSNSSDDVITLVDDSAPVNQKQSNSADDFITIIDDSSNEKKKTGSSRFVSKDFGSDSDDDLPDISFAAGAIDYASSEKTKAFEAVSTKKVIVKLLNINDLIMIS